MRLKAYLVDKVWLRPYLLDKPFKLHTDNARSQWLQQQWLLQQRHVSHHQARWLSLLAEYQYSVVHILGPAGRTNPAEFLPGSASLTARTLRRTRATPSQIRHSSCSLHPARLPRSWPPVPPPSSPASGTPTRAHLPDVAAHQDRSPAAGRPAVPPAGSHASRRVRQPRLPRAARRPLRSRLTKGAHRPLDWARVAGPDLQDRHRRGGGAQLRRVGVPLRGAARRARLGSRHAFHQRILYGPVRGAARLAHLIRQPAR